MARLSKNTLRTVRFYEEEGLLRPQRRTEGRHRLFSPRELRKLLLVSDLRAAGFALEDIREILDAKTRCQNGATAARQVIGRLSGQIELMNTRASLLRKLGAELEATRQKLIGCVRCDDSKLFPQSCGQCKEMQIKDTLPDALGVLWSVDR